MRARRQPPSPPPAFLFPLHGASLSSVLCCPLGGPPQSREAGPSLASRSSLWALFIAGAAWRAGPSLFSLPHEALVAQASREKFWLEPVPTGLALPLRHVPQCPWPPAASRKEAAPHTKVLREGSPPKATQAPHGAGQKQQGVYVPGQKLRLMEPHSSS